jgi:hypothetical protein
MRGYPEFAHIGFKVLCSIWGLRSILHMNFMEDYKRKKFLFLQNHSQEQKQLK